MSPLARLVVVALALLGLSGPASGMWVRNPELGEVDLVVEGTLVSLGSDVVVVRGQPYDLSRGTIVVHRVVYAEDEAPVEPIVELYSAQRADVICPRVSHEGHEHRRGLWLLNRTSSPGVYTSYMAQSVLRPDDVERSVPRVRLDGGVYDEETGRLDLEVRYENLTPDEATFDEVSLDAQGCVRGLGSVSIIDRNGKEPEVVASAPLSFEPPRRRLRVAPWRYARSTLSLSGLSSLAGRGGLSVRVVGSDLRDLTSGGWIWTGGEEFAGDYMPTFLSPDEVARLSLLPEELTLSPRPEDATPALSTEWLLLVAAVASIPLVTRGRTWRWTRFARGLGSLVAVTALALVPWSSFS